MRQSRRPALLAALAIVVACGGSSSPPPPAATAQSDPPEVRVGERLFLETRFAQFFATHLVGDDVNAPLAAGDPALGVVVKADGTTFTGPFAGESMNCRQCHLVDELDGVRDGGIRTYGDFARRAPLPDRGDGLTTTTRNVPALAAAALDRPGALFLHLDGEFTTPQELVRSTLTGRNFGWRADERAAALAHVARVLREDDGRGALAARFGAVSYADTFAGAPNVPEELRLPAQFQLDVTTASDEQLVDQIAALIAAHLDHVGFARDADGGFIGSPFDVFLAKNGLPRQPDPGEAPKDYTRRLRGLVHALASLRFVTAADGAFVHHAQPFAFGATELAGFEAFVAEPSALPATADELAAGAIGNCIACHFGPEFTDFEPHNIGVTQVEYEAIHGLRSFATLAIPDLAMRNADPAQFLPPSAAHPAAEGIFRRVPDAADARLTDLGVWNVFANPDLPAPQAALHELVARSNGLDPQVATDEQLLPLTIGLFKTPGLRDLTDSAPYMHDGGFEGLEYVLTYYLQAADLARAGGMRNGDVELTGIALLDVDLAKLAAFLRSLDQDYD